jgi:hypothetical protein
MKRMKLSVMKVIYYKFGKMEYKVSGNGKLIAITTLGSFEFDNEEGLIRAWKYSEKELNRLGRKLIKVYEQDDGTFIERDITPPYKNNRN